MTHRVLLFGTSEFGQPAFQVLLDQSSITVVGVISQPSRSEDRHGNIIVNPIMAWANTNHLTTYQPESLKTTEAVTKIQSFGADTFLVAAYGLILPVTVLSLPGHGGVNIHGSLLPAYRGASPIAAAIKAGDTTTGVTFMLMDQGMDTGPVISQHRLDIKPRETRPELTRRLAELAGHHVTTTLNSWWSGEMTPQPQPTAGVSRAPLLSRDDGHANWQLTAVDLDRQLRAYLPWPGLWARWNNQVIKFLSGGPIEKTSHYPPGTIISTSGGWGVACSVGIFSPTTVQLAGHRPQPADTMAGSYPGFIGSRLA